MRRPGLQQPGWGGVEAWGDGCCFREGGYRHRGDSSMLSRPKVEAGGRRVEVLIVEAGCRTSSR